MQIFVERIKNKLKGFTSVEIILAATLLSIVSLGVASGLSFVIQASADTTGRVKAQYLADEGIEAAIDIRRQDFNLLADGTYGLSLASNRWSLNGTSSTVEGFTRSLEVTTTANNAVTGEITKKITSTVTWDNPVKTASISTYVTNWRERVIVSWLLPAQQAALDVAGTNDAVKVDYRGNTAYVLRNGTPSRFTAINITNKDAPTVLSEFIFTPVNSSSATDFVISPDGNYAYVSSADNTYELRILNISNPSSITQAGFYNAPGNNDANGIAFVGTYIIISRSYSSTTAQYELEIIDISNPASPTRVGFYNATSTYNCYDVYVSGNYAYVSTSSTAYELIIFNVSNPASPGIHYTFNAPGTSAGDTVAGFSNYVFLSRADGTFSTIDVANPSAPAILATSSAGGVIGGFSWTSDYKYLFVATLNTAPDFQIWDISALPSMQATYVSSINLATTINDVVYDSTANRVYAAGTSNTQEFIIIQPL